MKPIIFISLVIVLMILSSCNQAVLEDRPGEDGAGYYNPEDFNPDPGIIDPDDGEPDCCDNKKKCSSCFCEMTVLNRLNGERITKTVDYVTKDIKFHFSDGTYSAFHSSCSVCLYVGFSKGEGDQDNLDGDDYVITRLKIKEDGLSKLINSCKDHGPLEIVEKYEEGDFDSCDD